MLSPLLCFNFNNFYLLFHWQVKVNIKSNDRILKANLSWTRKKSNSSDADIFVCVYVFLILFTSEHKFEFCQINLEQNNR